MKNIYYPKLFTPIKLAEGLELKNRIVMAPMATNFADEFGSPTENQCAYYRLRARKGVALIVSESNYVREDGKNGPTRMGLHSDHVIPAHKRLTAAVHEEGGKVCAQLHYGGYTISPQIIGRYPLSCSATPLDTKGEVSVGNIPRKMSIRDINDLVQCYAAAAGRAKEAEYDAIQIHCAHGYLLNQFLSPHVNKRQDEYGGSDENRLRIVIDIFKAIRNVIGPDFPMTVRFSGEETIDGGYGVDFVINAIHELERFNICEVSISGGNYEQAEKISPPYWFKPGYYSEVARQIRASVRVPVSTVGRIINPQIAEDILTRGDADLVYVGRELVAFPSFAEAAEKGLPVKECLGCNTCFDSMSRGQGFCCAINPYLGHDAEILAKESSAAPQSSTVKHIAVIGSGPAGLTAATEAARLGHQVKLYEKNTNSGGKLIQAGSMVEGKEVILRLADYLENEAHNAGVEIIYNHEIKDASELGHPDLVILSVGSTEKVLHIEGLEKFVSSDEAMQDLNKLGQRIIIVGGGLVGAELAEALAVKGREVTIIEAMDNILNGYEFPNKRAEIRKLCDLGIWIYVNSTITSADGKNITVKNKNNNFTLPYDDVVLATGYLPNLDLQNKLEQSGLKVVAIGDCSSAGKIINALNDGVKAIQNLAVEN